MQLKRIIFLIIVIFCLAINYIEGTGKDIFTVLFVSIISGFCIWFPKEIGNYVGCVLITSKTPGIFVSIFGWLFLLMLFIASIGYFI